MAQRKVGANPVTVGDGARDEVFRDLHGTRQIVPQGEGRTNRSRICASRTVRVNACKPGSGEQ